MRKIFKYLIITTLSVVCIVSVLALFGCSKKGGDSGHSSHTFVDTVTSPTCTEGGYTTHTCTCGESYTDSYVSAKGHTPKTAVRENEVKATCTKAGSYDEVVRCSDCNAIITSTPKTIEKTEHNYLNGICSECGDKEESLYDLTAIFLKDKTVTYDGTAHSLAIEGALPNGLFVTYDNNAKTNAGEYTVTATIKDSIKVYKTLTAVLKVEKRELNIVFSGRTDLVYNGNEQKTITATPANLIGNDTVNISITYSGAMVEGGIYTATATIEENNNYKLTQNNTITVTISRATHTVTFRQEGQPDIIRTVLDLADLSGNEIPEPAPINGYNVSWEQLDFANVNQNIIVNAVKTPIDYKITYVLDGGVNNSDNPKTYTIESATFYLATPTKTGATFSGWYTTANHLSDTRVLMIENGSYGDVTVYAHWLEYRITSAVGFEIDMEQEPPLVYRAVSNTTENIDLNDKITVSAGCTWNMYRDFEGNNELRLKAMSLAIGHNIAYIIVYHPDGMHFSRYKLDIYRLDIKEYAFVDGTLILTNGTIEEQAELNAPENNPHKDYYNFAGWSADNGNSICKFPYTVYDSVVFTAQYTPIEYEITYHPNGGILETQKTQYNVETTMHFDIPEKTGYDFAGWYLNEDLTGNAYDGIIVGSHGDISLYAKWTPHVYDITYNLNGGTNSIYNPKTYTIETPDITFESATKTGYDFGGWFSDKNLTKSATTVVLGSHGDIELWTKWTPIEYNISYELNGGTLNTTVNNYHIEKAVTFDTPEKAHYDFAGWYDNAEFIGQAVTGIAVGNYGDKTFYAKWTPTVYNITYVLNGGTLETDINTYTIETEIALDTPVLSYYDFVGWCENEDLSDKAISKLTIGNYGDKTFYAKWTPTVYIITYELNGGTLNTTANDYHIEKAVTFDTPERTGYDFDGWYSTEDFNGESVTGIAVGNFGDKSFYAKWTPIVYNITYVLNGGTLESDKNSYIIESEITLDTPVLQYYDFVGWCENEDLSDTAIKGISVGTYGDKTFYAKWALHEYKITYELDGGEVYGDLRNSFTVEDLPLDLNLGAPYKENYFFEGWYTDSEFNTPFVQITAVGDITVYAKWLTEDDYFTYSTNDIGLTVTGYNGTSTDIVIPSVYNNKPVTSIGSSAFEGCSGLTSITIPESVTSIGSGAFRNCRGLRKVYWNATDCISERVFIPIFDGCRSLNSVIIGENVNSIPSYAFKGCSGLTSVSIGNSVTSIGSYAFEDCSGLTSITIPDSVTSIGSYAFEGCSGLMSVSIGNSVTSIGERAFYGCSGLETVYWNATACSSAGSSNYPIFDDCTKLATVIIGENVNSIPSYALYNCDSLTSVSIGNSVTSIGNCAFYGCWRLTSITIPDSVTSIGLSAFRGCSGLTSVSIGNSVTSIGSHAFYGCSGLTSITIPDSITSIGSHAFYGCMGLTSITIPDSVTSIGGFAFSSGLKTVYWNATACTSAGSSSDPIFYNCTKLATVIIGENVTTISAYAFEGCSGLTSVSISNSVTSIGGSAFYGCSGLTSVYYKGASRDWARITIGSYNSDLTDATIYYYSETQPSSSGNYWHYDASGEIVVWEKETV